MLVLGLDWDSAIKVAYLILSFFVGATIVIAGKGKWYGWLAGIALFFILIQPGFQALESTWKQAQENVSWIDEEE